MGFLLLYFLPCFYCNVGDTYLFRGKRERLWVFFSGGFFELFVWALAVLGWRLVAPGTLGSRALFVVAAVSGLRSLFNFNPLIQMDGYFMLSEHLGIKNLRRQALSGLGRALRRASGLETEPATPELLERRIFGLRVDRFLTIFGAAALSYSALLVGALAFYSGGYVFENLGADALALYPVTLVGLLHKPALTAASAAKEVGKEKWEKLGEKKKRSRFVFLWAGIALVAAFFPWELRIRSDLSVLPLEREIVRAPLSGRVGVIHVNEGDRVEKGGLILEYDATELELSRRNKAAELEEAREQLPILGKGSPAGREGDRGRRKPSWSSGVSSAPRAGRRRSRGSTSRTRRGSRPGSRCWRRSWRGSTISSSAPRSTLRFTVPSPPIGSRRRSETTSRKASRSARSQMTTAWYSRCPSQRKTWM